jgi:predicted acetyltransferase
VTQSTGADDQLMRLSEPPQLTQPTAVVRDSWLAGERADCAQKGTSTELLDRAAEDFEQVVAERQGVRTWWGVPTTFFWYISGEQYLGELVIRHELTPALAESGGHIGYSVATPWRRQGHATRMLAAGLVECRRLGLGRVLLTCGTDNEPSSRVILTNGGVPDRRANGEDRFWIAVDGESSQAKDLEWQLWQPGSTPNCRDDTVNRIAFAYALRVEQWVQECLGRHGEAGRQVRDPRSRFTKLTWEFRDRPEPADHGSGNPDVVVENHHCGGHEPEPVQDDHSARDLMGQVGRPCGHDFGCATDLAY